MRTSARIHRPDSAERDDGEPELSGLLAGVSYIHPFRRYQHLALYAFEVTLRAGRDRTYLVLPPGAGKTVLGLEIARRLGHQTLVLSPNTAVQAQWLRQWAEDFRPDLVRASSEPFEEPITVLTYQALCRLDTENPSLDEQARSLWCRALGRTAGLTLERAEAEIERVASADPEQYRAELASYQRKARSLIVRGGQREDLLALLHPAGRQLIEEMRQSGEWTLILDECHHLLKMWGALTQALIEELGASVFVVGLTATPPGDMERQEARLYQQLFGSADFEVPTPAVVKEGDLAPYQTLAYLTSPLSHEIRFIESAHVRFQEILVRLLDVDFATIPFVDWLRRRVEERLSRDGVQVSWNRFALDNPDLARAALRFMYGHDMEIPKGARLNEEDRLPPTVDDWVVLIEDYCRACLQPSNNPRDKQAWEEIRQALPPLGYTLTRSGIRSYISPVDRVLSLSASKGVGASEILRAELAVLGEQLRALLVCDYEVAGSEILARLRGVLEPQAGSAALLLHTLVTGGLDNLRPVLVTGRTVACSRATAADLCSWIERRVPALQGRLATTHLFDTTDEGKTVSWEDVIILRPAHSWWQPRNYVPLLTQYFEEGHSRCLVGTRGLLGEGWDAKRVNVLVDLTAATTLTSVHQLRGRSLRLDPALPHKVADNWDIVCIAPHYPKGLADYARFVRKHERYYGLAPHGAIESGVSHVHPAFSPYAPPPLHEIGSINTRMLERVEEREQVYAQWQIGIPYRNLEAQTVRIRSVHSQRNTAVRVSGGPEVQRIGAGPGGRAIGTGIAAAGAIALGSALGSEVAGVLGSLLVGTGGGAWMLGGIKQSVDRNGPSNALEDMGRALAEALSATGAIGLDLGAEAVKVVPEEDGYYRCFLEGAGAEESKVFADSLDELLSPLGNARYIIPRYIPVPAPSIFDAVRIYLHQRARGRVGNAVVYHAIPDYLAANKERAMIFAAAWNRYVSAGRPLYRSDPRAQGIIEAQGNENPFEVTAQMRTVWS